MVFVVEPAIVAPLRGRAADRCTFADRVREISHPSGDAGAEAEKITAEATACAAPAVTPEPDAVVATIVDSNIASTPESWFPSPPELLRSTQAVPLVQRFAVQRRARRTSGSLMLLQCPCGGIVRCNGLFDGRTTNPRYFSDQANPISHQRRDSTTSVTSAATIAHRKPASPA